jgi:hypothetical protein
VTIQLHYTNLDKGLHNVFQSQVRLNGLEAGTLQPIEFDVDSSCPRGEFKYWSRTPRPPGAFRTGVYRSYGPSCIGCVELLAAGRDWIGLVAPVWRS